MFRVSCLITFMDSRDLQYCMGYQDMQANSDTSSESTERKMECSIDLTCNMKLHVCWDHVLTNGYVHAWDFSVDFDGSCVPSIHQQAADKRYATSKHLATITYSYNSESLPSDQKVPVVVIICQDLDFHPDQTDKRQFCTSRLDDLAFTFDGTP